MFWVFFLASFLLPISVLAGGADGFQELVGIPGLQDSGDFNGYVNALYALAISVAALIAVIQIVIAGAQYMMSDLVTQKSDAKDRIKNALIGLLIIIGATVILTTVNSNLTNMSLNFDPVVVDDRAPAYAVTQFEKMCNESDASTGACVTLACGDMEDVLLLTGKTCSETCKNISDSQVDLEYERLDSMTRCFTYKKSWATYASSALQTFADINCPVTATSCRAEFSNNYCEGILDGNLRGCQTQCLEQRNGVAFDEKSWACVFIDRQQPIINPINLNPNVTYTMKQNEDEIAGGYPIRQLDIVGNSVINGFIRVRYQDTGEEVDLSCSYVVPNLCTP